MTVTGLYSASRREQAQQHCELYFHPPLDRVGMLQWQRADQIVARGYAHASTVLEAVVAPLTWHLGVAPPGAS